MSWFSSPGFRYTMSDKDRVFLDKLIEISGNRPTIVMDVLFENGGGEKDLEQVVREIVRRRKAKESINGI